MGITDTANVYVSNSAITFDGIGVCIVWAVRVNVAATIGNLATLYIDCVRSRVTRLQQNIVTCTNNGWTSTSICVTGHTIALHCISCWVMNAQRVWWTPTILNRTSVWKSKRYRYASWGARVRKRDDAESCIYQRPKTNRMSLSLFGY